MGEHAIAKSKAGGRWPRGKEEGGRQSVPQGSHLGRAVAGREPLIVPSAAGECGSAALRPKPGINRWPLQRQLLKMFLIKVQEDLYVQYLLA